MSDIATKGSKQRPRVKDKVPPLHACFIESKFSAHERNEQIEGERGLRRLFKRSGVG
jgi:hypothetical protein